MEFFFPQESLTAMQWVLRAIIAFFFLLIAAKVMGQRSISQLRLLDFAMAISVGNIIAHPLSDEGLGMKGSVITMSVLVILYIIGVLLTLKWTKFRHLLDPSPIPLIQNGEIIPGSLKKAKISVDFLLSELRKDKVEDVQNVVQAFWEPDGTISIFLYPDYQTITKSDMEITTKPFSMPTTIIKEGKIDYRELSKLKIDEDWVKQEVMSKYNAEIRDILLATVDQNYSLKVFLF